MQECYKHIEEQEDGSITESDKQRIEALGLIKGESAIEETLDILEKLQDEGIDVTKIQKFVLENEQQRSTWLYEIDHENIEEIIKKLELDREYPIGSKINTMLRSYRGTGGVHISELDKQSIKKLGFKIEEKSATEETLDILEGLAAEGVKVIEAKKSIKRENGGKSKYRHRLLYELEQESIEEVIKKLGLEREYPIGAKIARMLQAYRGTGTRKYDGVRYKKNRSFRIGK